MTANTIYEQAKDIVMLFNERAFNAGLSFKVMQADSESVYVQASFDFAYYVNAHIEFRRPFFTTLKEGDAWPDSWNNDQLSLLVQGETEALYVIHELEGEMEDGRIGFQFQVEGGTYLERAVVICHGLNIRWEHPFNDSNGTIE